jgi:hypothetical protein
MLVVTPQMEAEKASKSALKRAPHEREMHEED